jgi:hypothetical protein
MAELEKEVGLALMVVEAPQDELAPKLHDKAS